MDTFFSQNMDEYCWILNIDEYIFLQNLITKEKMNKKKYGS